MTFRKTQDNLNVRFIKTRLSFKTRFTETRRSLKILEENELQKEKQSNVKSKFRRLEMANCISNGKKLKGKKLKTNA